MQRCRWMTGMGAKRKTSVMLSFGGLCFNLGPNLIPFRLLLLRAINSFTLHALPAVEPDGNESDRAYPFAD
jgi:hypothetical protein